MRTTLDIADDVLLVAKEAAKRQKTSVGSELARRGLQAGGAAPMPPSTASPLNALGIHPRPRQGNAVVTNELINRLRDDDI